MLSIRKTSIVCSETSPNQRGEGTCRWCSKAGDLPTTITHEQLALLLEGDGDQFYLQKLPENDGWGNSLDFQAVFDPTSQATFSNLITSSRAIGIRSRGRDGVQDGTGTYTNGTFLGTNYDGDIVWSDGYFVRVPGGLNSATASSPEDPPVS